MCWFGYVLIFFSTGYSCAAFWTTAHEGGQALVYTSHRMLIYTAFAVCVYHKNTPKPY